ncbi:MAG: DUF3048 domain-containing protein [Chloroflexi bacterium]|nr:DUF3048 domain-containing protein [Chloroflexota bacterium]
MKILNFRRAVGLAIGAALLAACGSAATPTAAPASTLPPAGVTLVAPTQPPATTAPQPAAATPAPPTPAPAVTPVPEGQIGPANFPPNVDPLTGETVDPTALDRIPLAIKVSNYPDVVRPQSGLSFADLVFEHFVEGGATRFTAVYYSKDAEKVGSVRSARLIDLEIPNMYRAMLGYSGSSEGVRTLLKQVPWLDRVLSPQFGEGCPPFCRFPEEGLAQEHTEFTSTKDLRAVAEQRGLNKRPDLHGMTFNATPPPDGQPAKQVTFPYNASYVLWVYNQPSGRWLRWNTSSNSLTEHKDRLTGQQLSAANVVAIYANHVCNWAIIEDANGWYSIEIQIWGSGPAKIFRDGQVYDATWVRNDPKDMLGFVDANGQPFPLKPGNTWFQLVQLESPTKVEKGNEWTIDPTEPGCVRSGG